MPALCETLTATSWLPCVKNRNNQHGRPDPPFRQRCGWHFLRTGVVSPLECLDALETRIAAVNAPVNALVTLCFDRARNHAHDMMAKPAARTWIAGWSSRADQGSDRCGGRALHPRVAHFCRSHCAHVRYSGEHLEAEGGIVYAMSNTPEFGAGAQTFNDVFGITRNPWNTRSHRRDHRAELQSHLATGMAWVAHGSDMGGMSAQPRQFLWRRGLAAFTGPGGVNCAGQDRRHARRRRPHGAQCG